MAVNDVDGVRAGDVQLNFRVDSGPVTDTHVRQLDVLTTLTVQLQNTRHLRAVSILLHGRLAVAEKPRDATYVLDTFLHIQIRKCIIIIIIIHTYIRQKQSHIFLSLSSLNVDLFLKFFLRHTQQKIYDEN